MPKVRTFQGVLLLLAALLLGSFIAPYPSQVRDVYGTFHSGISLAYPTAYTVFAPFFQAADLVTVFSLRQHFAFILFLNLAWIFCRLISYRCAARAGAAPSLKFFALEFLKALGFNLAYAAFLAVTILIPRPVAALALADPDQIAVDFHSHTSYSWDARRSFTPLENLKWHKKGGFHAAFITDHNVFEGAEEAQRDVFEEKKLDGIIPMRGEEVSLFQSHWVLLGIREAFPNRPYDNGMDGIREFLQKVNAMDGAFAIASLPEYWFYHWGADVAKFVEWGAGGFEIANSAPKALDFPRRLRREILEICSSRSLAVTGITDSHGWGSTIYSWNVLTLPGWRNLDPRSVEGEVIRTLKSQGFKAVLPIVRVKHEPVEHTLALLVSDPPLQIWTLFRSLPVIHRLVFLLWLVGIGVLEAGARKWICRA